MNEMMNHLGTAIIVLTGSLIAFANYPSIGYLFIVSPIACVGVIFFLSQINAKDIDHEAARGLTAEVSASKKDKGGDYLPPSSSNSVGTAGTASKNALNNKPSFIFGMGKGAADSQLEATTTELRAETPLQILRDPTLLVFLAIVFLFHTANGTVLPLVMQTLAIGNGRSGILMSGLCIIVAQVCTAFSCTVL